MKYYFEKLSNRVFITNGKCYVTLLFFKEHYKLIHHDEGYFSTENFIQLRARVALKLIGLL